jgi:hypothetical protein
MKHFVQVDGCELQHQLSSKEIPDRRHPDCPDGRRFHDRLVGNLLGTVVRLSLLDRLRFFCTGAWVFLKEMENKKFSLMFDVCLIDGITLCDFDLKGYFSIFNVVTKIL